MFIKQIQSVLSPLACQQSHSQASYYHGAAIKENQPKLDSTLRLRLHKIQFDVLSNEATREQSVDRICTICCHTGNDGFKIILVKKE